MKSFIFALAGICALSACAGEGVGYAFENYDFKPSLYSADGRTWRIFDRPDLGKFMITPTVGKASLEGAKAGATFGIGGNNMKLEQTFRDAARSFASSKGCTITENRMVLVAQWEYSYTCK
ncbi:hypothetical protein DL1_00065 [Thioclava dalianensis]|uniref:Lipoprotein n=1 Tax=Thioclava dalianensis TaxID=1185766 RepID=A0A074TS79_9RHOB|nr:hypothetical protein [Thioclava dalianensis]KEP71753.1 hypothetical protein DL1_00065 [Thioclava dalianensis]SFN63376.1 hypothetical protein SAMN05216224_10880 [Thioclava dalianensis]